MPDNPLVRLTDVSLQFGERQILQKVSLEIGPQEILTVIGPNGAGKSCLLKIILGLYHPSNGNCWRQPGLTLGYMPQKMAIDNNFPLKVQRFLSLTQTGSKALNTKAQQSALERVGASHLLQQSMHNLSGGEFQRVLLARALLRKPDILILDEPTQGVDVQGQQALFQLLSKLRQQEQFAILMVSHDLHFVMAETDRVICLNRHVCCSGSAETVTAHPDYISLFGSAANNMGIYTHHHNHRHDLHGEVVTDHQHAPGADHD